MTSVPPPWIYQVFLSFRGGDTRTNFVDHLYKELTIKGVYTFRDDSKLERGRSIGPALLQAIEDSRVTVVVLSQNYASSDWCLDELVKILECMETLGRIVIPVFHNVDPSDVEKQSGSFGLAFLELQERLKQEMEMEMEMEKKVKRWKEALTQVATISGWDSRYREEASLIEQIVRDISDKVMCAPSTDAGELVGMGSHVEEMDSLLQLDMNVVRMLGIWGLSGIGKTTIARVMFDRHCRQFEACCFLSNVGDKFRSQGEAALQHQLLSTILLERDLSTWSLGKGSNLIKERLSRRKVLIILDDVDDLEQLEVLANNLNWFGPGSRIIITTQDKHLLDAHGVNVIYKAKCLENKEALQLFSQYAFHQNQPKKDYWELSRGFVSYANGLPLALKVLGSFLYNKSTCQWKNELHKLEEFPNRKIQDVLKLSYDGLEESDKKVFLDLACFFNGENVDEVRDILDACGFFPDRAFGVLMDNAMLSISNGKLYMHALLQQLGGEIVRKESEENGKRSRLWKPDDVFSVLTEATGTKKVEGLLLDMSKSREMRLSSKAFENMFKLRLIKLHNPESSQSNFKIQLRDEQLQKISNELRYLRWDGCPSKSLPSNFSPEKLVELNLPFSNIEHLWGGRQQLGYLKVVNLNHSNLTRTPDLSAAQKLEVLNFRDCLHLVEVSSIQFLTKLKSLDLKGCKRLRSIPTMVGLKLLETLDLSECSQLGNLPELPRNIKYLYVGGTAIEELPTSLEDLAFLMELDMKNCTRLRHIPISTCKLNSLESLNISGCPHLLKRLSGNGKGELPKSVGCCSDCTSLRNFGSENRRCFEGIPLKREAYSGTNGKRDRYSYPTCHHLTNGVEETEKTCLTQVAPQKKFFKQMNEADKNLACNGGVAQMNERPSFASDPKASPRNGVEQKFTTIIGFGSEKKHSSNSYTAPKFNEAELTNRLDDIPTSVKFQSEHPSVFHEANILPDFDYEKDFMYHRKHRVYVSYGEPELLQVSLTPASISTDGKIASKVRTAVSTPVHFEASCNKHLPLNRGCVQLQISFSSECPASMKGSAISSKSFSRLQLLSRNLLHKLSSRGGNDKSSYPEQNGYVVPGSKLGNGINIQEQKKALGEYLSMSVEAIHQANAFENIERSTYALIQHSGSLTEKTELEHLMAILSKLKESIPGTMISMRMAHAKRNGLPLKSMAMNANLVYGEEKLSSLESKSRIVSEEEEKIDADIKRLMARKKQIQERKSKIAEQMEKTYKKVTKDLGELEKLEEEMKEADEKWLKGKENLAAANASWKIMRERLNL
ncbi:Disease resistance protein RUN1 [Linum perenne]